MNLLEAASTLPGLTDATVFDQTPDELPSGAYAVVSELTDGTPRTYLREADGRVPRVRRTTTLLTLWGVPEADLADLRPTWRAAQDLADRLTRTLDGTPATVAATGPDVPARRDPATRRPWAAVRFTLTYLTGATS